MSDSHILGFAAALVCCVLAVIVACNKQRSAVQWAFIIGMVGLAAENAFFGLTIDNVAVNGGSLTVNSAASYTAGGSTTIAGGTLQLAPSSASTGNFSESSGTLLGPGALAVTGSFSWSGGGISTSTGRGRPLRTCVKARRIASGTASATVTCSHHLVTC